MQTTTRKGLPLAEVTDIAGTNYTVGPSGRTITTTGKVRDTERALASLLDTFVEYSQNESITGSFDFQSTFITEKGNGQLFLNNTGATRNLGDVVIVDPSTDTGIILPTSAGVSAGKVGVVAETVANGSVGRVAFNGFIRVKVVGGVVRNQYLTTQNASAIAAGGTYQTTGSFALSVTNQDVNNMVLALLHPGSSLEGGGQVNGNVGISTAPNSSTILAVAGTPTGVTINGISSIPTFGSATGSANGIWIQPITVNGFTTPQLTSLRLQPPVFGTTQSIGILSSIFVDAVPAPAGVINNYILDLNAASGASGVNETIHALGTSNFGRIRASLGAPTTSAMWSLSGWGTGATVTVASNSTDQRGTITITAGTGPTGNPVATFTFADGAWSVSPFPHVNQVGQSSGTITAAVIGVNPTTTGFNFQWFATPTAGALYVFTWLLLG